MTVKMLTDGRGPLQGVTVEAIVRNAYGREARYMPNTEGESLGLIVRPAADDPDPEAVETVDTVIEMHETDG